MLGGTKVLHTHTHTRTRTRAHARTLFRLLILGVSVSKLHELIPVNESKELHRLHTRLEQSLSESHLKNYTRHNITLELNRFLVLFLHFHRKSRHKMGLGMCVSVCFYVSVCVCVYNFVPPLTISKPVIRLIWNFGYI